MLALIGLVMWILIHTAIDVGQSRDFAVGFPKALDGLIIAIIILELLQTVWEQIRAPNQDDEEERTEKERLGLRLVKNFLVIGTVSAIRHILVIGAELSLGSVPDTRDKLSELRINIWLAAATVIAVVIVEFAKRFLWAAPPSHHPSPGSDQFAHS